MRGNRWFFLSILFAVGGFVLAWKYGDPGSFAAIAGVALAGGHASNFAERWRPQEPSTDTPEES